MAMLNLPPAPIEEELRAYRDAKAEVLDGFHRDYFRRLMDRHQSLTAAAAAAHMDRKHLRELLRRYGFWATAT